MKDWWLKLGCYLTGYSYAICKNTSEFSRQRIKKFTASILLISIVWAFISFSFAWRYADASTLKSLLVMIVAVIGVVQIERQVILSHNWPSKTFRGLLALIMALIGSVIIDQVLFQADVDKQQISNTDLAVNLAMPGRVEAYEKDKSQYLEYYHNTDKSLDSLGKINPMIKSRTSQILKTKDSSGKFKPTQITTTDAILQNSSLNELINIKKNEATIYLQRINYDNQLIQDAPNALRKEFQSKKRNFG